MVLDDFTSNIIVNKKKNAVMKPISREYVNQENQLSLKYRRWNVVGNPSTIKQYLKISPKGLA